MALEGALKLKEISYIHAEGYAAGEMKHGPIALIDEAVPVIVIAPSGPLFDKTVIEHAGSRGARRQDRADLGRGGHRGGRRRCDGNDRNAERASADRAAHLRRAGAAARLSCRGGQGHRRRSAAQPRQIGDGGVTA